MTKIAPKSQQIATQEIRQHSEHTGSATKGKERIKKKRRVKTHVGLGLKLDQSRIRQEVSRLPLQAQFLTAVWISPQNTGSHGNLSLIHKSLAPIQSNLIPSLGRASSGPPTPHPYHRSTQHGYQSISSASSQHTAERLLKNFTSHLLGSATFAAFWRKSPLDN